jgi:tetratricopeptide (TPR) repeat protein
MGAVLILAAGVTFMWALTGMVERRPYAFTGRELLPEPPAGTSVRPEPEWKRTAAFDALVARGCELCRAGDHDEAIATLTSAILLDATSPHAWYVFANRSVAHAALGHGERALLDAQEAMLIDPGRAEGLVYSGYARSVLHEDEKAIADYRRALAGLGERSELAAWCRDALATLEARQRSH